MYLVQDARFGVGAAKVIQADSYEAAAKAYAQQYLTHSSLMVTPIKIEEPGTKLIQLGLTTALERA